MNVALIADPHWLSHETALFRRLIVGLADESVRAIPVVPWGVLREELSLAPERVDYPPSRWAALSGLRLRRLAGALRATRPDVLHVMDGALAPWLGPLRRSLGAPMVVNCWSNEQYDRVVRRGGETLAVLPTERLAANVGEGVGSGDEVGRGGRGTVIRPGVMGAPEEARPPLASPDEVVCCLVICEAQAEGPVGAMLEGLAQVRGRLPQLQVFVYSFTGEEHRLWRVAKRLGLLGVFNLVAAEPGSRRLLLGVDAVIRPQPMRTVRTLTLQAMASGRPILAAADAWEDCLIAGETAEVIDAPGPAEWAARFEALTKEPDRFRRLGEGGRAYVRAHHSFAAYIDRVIRLYHEATGQPLAFTSESRS